MELKALLLGLVFSLGVFGLKVGAGLSYRLRQDATWSRKIITILLFVIGYSLIFRLADLVTRTIAALNHLDTVLSFLQHGMSLHFMLAGLLLVWGIILLKRETSHSHGWLLLTLPCPVCFIVIVFSDSFLISLFPEVKYILTALACGFLTISLATALLMIRFGTDNAGHDLGTVMVLVALYFLFSMMMIPQFAEIERIYRLSLGSVVRMDAGNLSLLLTGAGTLFAFSFMKSYWGTSWK